MDVHLDTVPLNPGSYTHLNLGVVSSEDHQQGCMVAIDRYRTDGTNSIYVSGIETGSASNDPDESPFDVPVTGQGVK